MGSKDQDAVNRELRDANRLLQAKRGNQGWDSPRSKPEPYDKDMPRDIGGIDRPE